MKRAFLCVCTLALVLQAEVRQTGAVWELENQALKVSVKAENGWLSVLEKESGTLWEQEDPARRNASADQIRGRRASSPIVVDGDPAEWKGTPHEEYVWLPWKGDNGEANCSGGAKLMWDDEMFYLYVRIRDDNVAFGGEATTEWWESDSVEFWVDSVQVGLHLAPAGEEVAVNARGEAFAGSKVGVRMIEADHLPGYELEVAMPIRHFPVLRDPVPGIRFSFALGLNDADPAPGAPVRRDRQSYSPRSWTHSAPATFAVAGLTGADGTIPERSRENDRSANAAGGRISGMERGSVPDSLVFQYLVRRGQLRELPLQVTLQLVADQPSLDVTLQCLAGGDVPMKTLTYPAALYPPAPGTYFMGVANYTDGRYLPVGDSLCRNRVYSVGGGDLPFVLVTDGTRGLATILLTPQDGSIQMQPRTDDPDQFGFPGFRWMPQKDTWGVTRRGRLAFFPGGGHVAACKIYRTLAVEQGLVRTLKQKEKRKPDVRKLFGAVNWWGAGGLSFVREAVAAGMTHGLLNGRPSPDDMTEIIKLGWLVGEYDNYEDINDSEIIARAKAPVKTHAVVKPDGEFMTAWISRDKDMNPTHTYMKQCTGMMTTSARIVIPQVLETYPYNTRFLDVTTATGLKECYSPLHPATRVEDQRFREQLCAYVGDELGLVAGGEHGRYWDVPYLDYHEGMMGGGMYSWPAGYLRDVKDREELDERYLKYSIDPANRVPMFELVFHDCVVNYWYWGACSDYLHEVAPEITDRKTAMNVLYGTPPMMWAHSHGLRWQIPGEREKMLEIYRNVCKLHEILGDQEMLSHEFVTSDRQVQRTTFADGTTCTANFGPEPYSLPAGQRTPVALTLRQNDFAVKGPRIEQWRVSSATTPPVVETFIRSDSCLFADFAGREFQTPAAKGQGRVWATLVSPGRLQISLAPNSRVALDVAVWNSRWRGQPVALFEAGSSGELVRRLPVTAGGVLALTADEVQATYVALLGEQARKPDLSLEHLQVEVEGIPVDPHVAPVGEAVLDISVKVRNSGLAAAGGFAIVLYLDGAAGPVLARKTFAGLAPNAAAQARAKLNAASADGPRRIVALIEADRQVNQCGKLRVDTRFVGPFRDTAFAHRWPLQLTIPPGAAAGLPVERQFEPGEADPGNLRVRFATGTVVPAQFEPSAHDATKGMLVFVLPAGLTAGPQDVTVLGPSLGSTEVLPHTARFEVADDGGRLRFDTYAASLLKGTLGPISVLDREGKEMRVASQIIVSSKETGWSREDGPVESFGLRHRGPVRAVFTCTKLVSEKFQVSREWRFYGDRFEVHTSSVPPIGCLTRALYTADATATNESGKTVEMDGHGEAEGFGFKQAPQWYALYAESWNNVCIALSRSSGVTYWDSGSHRGQIALNHAGKDPEKRVYIWGSGAENDGFAKAAAEAYVARMKED